MSECEYCKFRNEHTYSPQRNIYKEADFEDKHLRFILVRLMRQDSGYELTVNIASPDVFYRRGIAIKYCPMCGRKLEEDND